MSEDCLCFGLTLPPRLILSTLNALCISIVIALSTLPDDNFLCDFCRWSLSELLLIPAFFPQMGHTFIAGFLWCHSIETFPCNFLSRSNRILAKPSFGCARRCTRFKVFHASNRVNFLQKDADELLWAYSQGPKRGKNFSKRPKWQRLKHLESDSVQHVY